MEKPRPRNRDGHPSLRVRPANSRKSSSRSAARALDLLEYFGKINRPLRAIEISKALDMHPSSVNQLVKTLVDAAHLTFDARAKTYLPSPCLRGFGNWLMRCYGNDDWVSALLEEVHNTFGGIVTLTTPNDMFMQILDFMGTLPGGSRMERGYQVSVFGSAAVGDAYLSGLSDREVTRLTWRARIPRETTAEVLKRISRARSTGLAEGFIPGGDLYSIAALLPSYFAPIPLVIAVATNDGFSTHGRQEMERSIRNVISKWTSSLICTEN